MARSAADVGARELHAQEYGDPVDYLACSVTLYAAGEASGITTVAKIPLTMAAIR